MDEQIKYSYLIGQLVQCQFLIGLVTRLKLDTSKTLIAEVLWCNSDLQDKSGSYLPSIVQGWHEQYLKYRGEKNAE